jgi:hypothetical protein
VGIVKAEIERADPRQRYGETWRLIHKLVHNILNIKVAAKYVPYQDLENKFLLAGLLDTPDALFNHIRRFSYSLSTQMIFGFRCPDISDPMLKRLFEVSLSQFILELHDN